jgi:phosphatidylglycerophosphatase A
MKAHKNFFNNMIGSAFGLGLSPIMPGTFGALLGVLFHIVIVLFLPVRFQLILLIIVFCAVCMANHMLYPWAKEFWNSKDPQHFVLDEVAGYLFVPILFHNGEFWPTVIWGFVLFRIFDIIKLPIARQIDQNMHNAWGVILDDLVSAVYAVIVMLFLSWVGPFEIGGIAIHTP